MNLISLRFVSKNPHKFREAQALTKGSPLSLIKAPLSIAELQTRDEIALVKDKAIKAFQEIGKPLLVEHTGLYLKELNDLPGGLTQTFWDALEADRFAHLFGGTDLVARTQICYCDGRKFHYFSGEVLGYVATKPRGNREFQWDCIFIPKGRKRTFAEMGDTKNDISMRKLAFDKLLQFLFK